MDIVLAMNSGNHPLFSVLINDTVRIDSLSIYRAQYFSGTFSTLFSLPDSKEDGQVIKLTLTCYDADGITLATHLSESLLRWIFNLFENSHFSDGIEVGIDDYCHGLQIIDFLDITPVGALGYPADHLTGYILTRYDSEEVLRAVRHFYETLNRNIQSSLTSRFSVQLEKNFRLTGTLRRKRSDDALRLLCLMLARMVLEGMDTIKAVNIAYDAILDENEHGIIPRWQDRVMNLSPSLMSVHDLREMIPLFDQTYLGFLFFKFSRGCEPAGWFTADLNDLKTGLVIRQRVRTREGIADTKHERVLLEIGSGVSKTDPISDMYQVVYPDLSAVSRPWALEPYCIKAENMYRDEGMMAQLYAALGTNIEQIRAWARAQ